MKAKAEQRVRREKAEAALSRFSRGEVDRSRHPYEVLMDDFWWVSAFIEHLEALVESPTFEDAYEDKVGVGRMAVELEILADQRRHRLALLQTFHRIGIDEREVRLKEDAQREVVAMLLRGLDAIGATAEQKRSALLAMKGPAVLEA